MKNMVYMTFLCCVFICSGCDLNKDPEKSITSIKSKSKAENTNSGQTGNSKDDDEILLDFYREIPVKFKERHLKISDFWNYSNDELESVHNYVQWLFPIDTAGMSSAPLLTKEAVEKMRNDPVIRKNVLKSFDVMLKFLGFKREDGDDCNLLRNADFDERTKNWVIDHSHNHLRITRLLKFLKYQDLENCAQNLFNEISTIKGDKKYKDHIEDKTYDYWQKAFFGATTNADLLPHKI